MTRVAVANRAIVASLVAIMMSVGFQTTSEARATVVPDTNGGDSYSSTVAGLGAKVMKNQADLDSFITWMNGIPGLADQGYYGAENDARTRTITLQWHGTSSLQAQVLDQAKQRAININIHAVAFTRHQVEVAASRAFTPAASAHLGGFKVTMVEGPTIRTPEMVVTGHFPDALNRSVVPSKAEVDSLSNAFAKSSGVPTRVVFGGDATPFTTRATDTSPFNAGGEMEGLYNYACSSGFGLLLGTSSYTTTARHCNEYPYHAADVPSSVYGSPIATDNQTGAYVLSGQGFPWVFDGVWNNSAGFHKTVSGLRDVAVGDSVCSSGGYTGVHCLLTVNNLSVWFEDVPGLPEIQTISASTTNSALIAGGAGDSGGPIMIPNVDGVHVWAVGIFQGAPPNLVIFGGLCDKYARDPGYGCSQTVLFTSERVFLHNVHATLRTG
ncbi:MAG: S1 family peptidase [Chloroflexota bacterium]|nr:S1 family peptidase [Chloroflexota bacterium]